MNNNYRIKIARAGSEFEVEGDKEFVLEMLERFEKSIIDKPAPQQGIQPPIPITETEVRESAKTLSVGEFIRKLGVKKHVDLVLAFGYYLEKNQGASSFTPADINTCYYDSKLESSNTSQMIVLNIRRGFFMEAKQDKGEGKKRYTLTNSGEEYIEQQLSQVAE
ncbi:MAG: hypothetical protein L0287_20740 [Anaerolineae bacterium]|nr:hypothetical protein [Anaerolineae bacterium]MCI0607437.1 hypothetical protein [Anaerolineae bacterium]